MPIFRSGKGNAPAWAEMTNFELIELAAGDGRTLSRQMSKEELLVCRGRVVVTAGDVECTLGEGGKLDLNGPQPPAVTVRAVADALVFRAMGRWKSITSSGIFTVTTTDPPTHDTPYDYAKTTRFDNHYHDFDEYWILFEGRCRVATEGKFFDVGPGDCVATGMGWHHDVLSIEGDRPVRAVWFEGTLEGDRLGHLWEPKHGKAQPKAGRV